MGVLNFHSTFRHSHGHIDVLELDVNNLSNDVHHADDVHEDTTVHNVTRNKRKRTKSGCKSQYNFKDYGIDERRRGSKHQRRKQNFHELQELAGDDTCEEEVFFLETQMTVFAELFLDESKMKVWESFIALSEDKQGQYIEEFHTSQKPSKSDDGAGEGGDDVNYLLIDKKLRDMLRSKQLSNDVNGLLKYYEDDVTSCIGDVSGPAILILDIESAYDRMLVYAVCQYMRLSASTIKLKTSTLLEIEIDDLVNPPGKTLAEYLRGNPS